MPHEYKVTKDFTITDGAQHVIIKVNNDDLCYVYNEDNALNAIDHLSKVFLAELEEEPDVKSGWKKVSLESVGDKTKVIYEQDIGRLYNGPKTAIRTITFSVIHRGNFH